MAKAGVIGIARFVLHNKEHLAALIPAGPALMLGTLRWADEIRPADDLGLPSEGTTANGLKAAELDMAQQLIAQMTGAWKPWQFRDDFTAAIHTLVARKAKAGKKATVKPFEDPPEPGGDNVVDLPELLRKSLSGKPAKARAPAKKVAAKKTSSKTSSSRKKAA